MSPVLYAAPVTSNTSVFSVSCSIQLALLPEGEKFKCCFELFDSELFVQYHLHCLCSLGELEPVHREKWSSSRFVFVQSCSAQGCLDNFVAICAL